MEASCAWSIVERASCARASVERYQGQSVPRRPEGNKRGMTLIFAIQTRLPLKLHGPFLGDAQDIIGAERGLDAGCGGSLDKNREIWACALKILRCYGEDARTHARCRADELLRVEDAEGHLTSIRMLNSSTSWSGMRQIEGR